MLLLYYRPVVMVYVFTVGVAVTHDSFTLAADFLTHYSYINARDGLGDSSVLLARCITGLGPSGNDNGVLGGWYFDNNKIPSSGEQASCSSGAIKVRPGGNTAGVSNIRQCGAFSTSEEGIYTCTMLNSSMMNQSLLLGLYFTGRSKSLDLCTYLIT